MDKYIFIHVPKTAGRTVRRVLAELLGEHNVSPPVGVLFDKVDIEEISRYQLIAGHFSFDQLAQFPGRRVLTFLRDPVDVIVSKYFFFRNNVPDLNDPWARLCKEFSLRELVRQGKRVRAFFNQSVWQFAGLGRHGDQFPESTALRLAQDHLQSVDFIGLYEDLTESLDVMSYTFGWPLAGELPRENVTIDRSRLEDLDRETVCAIREVNYLDAELYRLGQELFRQRRRAAWAEAVRRKRAAGGMPEEAITAARDGSVVKGTVSEVKRLGDGAIRIVRVTLQDREDTAASVLSGDIVTLRVTLLASKDAADVCAGIRLVNPYEQTLYRKRYWLASLEVGRLYRVVFRFPARIQPDSYRLAVEVLSGELGVHTVHDYLPRAATLQVTGYGLEPFGGIADLGAEVQHTVSEASG